MVRQTHFVRTQQPLWGHTAFSHKNLTNVTLMCGGRGGRRKCSGAVRTHCLFLSAASPFLRDVLLSVDAQMAGWCLVLPQWDLSILKSLSVFVSTGVVTVAGDKYAQFVDMLATLQIETNSWSWEIAQPPPPPPTTTMDEESGQIATTDVDVVADEEDSSPLAQPTATMQTRRHHRSSRGPGGKHKMRGNAEASAQKQLHMQLMQEDSDQEDEEECFPGVRVKMEPNDEDVNNEHSLASESQLDVNSLPPLDVNSLLPFDIDCPVLDSEAKPCGKHFKSEHKYMEHLTSHLGEPCKCRFCSKTFKRPGLRRIHEQLHLRPFKCEICGTGFGRKSNLEGHIRMHRGERPYICDVCGKGFPIQSSLVTHKKQSHPEAPKPFSCDFCALRFVSQSQLNNHRRTHTGEKPYVCEVCGRGFSTKQNMLDHTRLHRDEFDFECNICEEKFKWKQSLERHLMDHTGVRPYPCTQCSQTFKTSNSLKKHGLSVHTDIKQFPCQFCGSRFSTSSGVNRHQKKNRCPKLREHNPDGLRNPPHPTLPSPSGGNGERTSNLFSMDHHRPTFSPGHPLGHHRPMQDSSGVPALLQPQPPHTQNLNEDSFDHVLNSAESNDKPVGPKFAEAMNLAKA